MRWMIHQTKGGSGASGTGLAVQKAAAGLLAPDVVHELRSNVDVLFLLVQHPFRKHQELKQRIPVAPRCFIYTASHTGSYLYHCLCYLASPRGNSCAEPRDRVRQTLHRGLRAFGDHVAHPHKSPPPTEETVCRHPDLRCGRARPRPGQLNRMRAQPGRRDRRPRPTVCSKGIGGSPRRVRRRFSIMTASASFGPATSATTTRKAISSSPNA